MLQGSATYAAGAVLQRAATFLLLPLFTRILSPAEFGQIGVLTSLAAALGVLLSFGLETAVFRGYRIAESGEADSRTFLNTVGGFALLIPVSLGVAIAALAAPPVAAAFDTPVEAVRYASLGAAFTASATLVPLAVLRAEERLRDYLELTALQVIVTPALTVIFVMGIGGGATGWMLAYALGALVLLVRGLVILRHRWSMALDTNALRTALAFGIPLIPHALSHWGLSVSDRAILGAFVPQQAVGNYYVAYLACLPISLIAIATAQAAQPVFTEAQFARGLSGRRLKRLATFQAMLVVVCGFGVALLAPPVISLMLPDDYQTAATIAPLIALGTTLFGLYLMPMNAIALTAGRTQRVWIITVGSALINVALNLALVPSVGVMAAAINTVVGYGVLLVGIVAYMRRVCDPPLPYDSRRLAIGVVVIGVSTLVASLVGDPASAAGATVRGAFFVGVLCLLGLGPFRDDVRAAIAGVRRAMSVGTP